MTAKIAIGMAAGLAVGCVLNAIGVGGWVERAVVDVIIDLFRSNPIRAMADENMLQIIVFADLFVLAAHATITYPLLRLGARLNPLAFYRNMCDPIALAFSTTSSNATRPVTLESVEHKLSVSRSIASFTIPLGATINMDGTAIMQGVDRLLDMSRTVVNITGDACVSWVVASSEGRLSREIFDRDTQ